MKTVNYILFIVLIQSFVGCRKQHPCPNVNWSLDIASTPFDNAVCVDNATPMWVRITSELSIKNGCSGATGKRPSNPLGTRILTGSPSISVFSLGNPAGSDIMYEVTLEAMCCSLNNSIACPNPSNGAQNLLVAQGTKVVNQYASNFWSLNTSDFKLFSINCC